MKLPWLEPHKIALSQALDHGRLGHAPLLTGPAGLGKALLAEWLVRRTLCLDPQGSEPCGQCRSCELIEAGAHADFFRIAIPEGKKDIPVDSIRELTASLQLTPRVGTRRLGLIEVAEAMNVNAANALLKTLEEPSENAWLVLISHSPARLPATIRSRCQPVPVRPPERSVALAWLEAQCPGHESTELAEALALVADAPLAAKALLDDQGLTFGHDVLDGLLAIASGKPVAVILSESWLESPPTTWRWLAVWTSVLMRAAHGMAPEHWPGGRQLPERLDAASLAGLWEQALRGSVLTRGSARQDLLLGKWLLEWKQMN